MVSGLKDFISSFLKDIGLAQGEFSVHPLKGDGSMRIFLRIIPSVSGPCFVAMDNPPADNSSKRENLAYVMIGKHLHRKGIPVPKIYRCDLERGWFIMEDMGHTSLQDHVSASEDPLPVYEKVMESLFRLQVEGARDFDPAWCWQTQRYDRTVQRRYESDYFRDAFLCLYLGLKREWHELETPFSHLAEMASGADNNFFLHRDFQSRNIMISKGNIGIIDWQGGRLGPLGYDAASLIIDPYVGLSSQRKHKLYRGYLLLVKEHNAKWIDPFKKYFPYLAIQRNLQILGAFSYLASVRKKSYFKAYIPAAMKTLRDLLDRVDDPEISALKHLVDELGSREH
ncbi:MAG: phosphotransferase [Thermodesulfobacteriota bacterium]|nr:phosphotransferase [Thermodesulfobacteriota bacterium]